MPVRDIRDRVSLSSDLVETLSIQLDNHALAAAVKLINAQIRSHGRGLSMHADLISALGIPRRQKASVVSQLSGVFETASGYWQHPDINAAFDAERKISRARRRKSHNAQATAARATPTQPPVDTSPAKAEPSEETCGPLFASVSSQTHRASGEALPTESALDVTREEGFADQQPATPRTNDDDTAPIPGNSLPPGSADGGACPDTDNRTFSAPPARTLPARRGGQAELFEAGKSTTTGGTSTAYPASADPSSGTSLLKLVYDRGVGLLMQHGQTPDRARSCLAMLLKDYDTAYVIKAIDVIEQRKGRVAEPFSYMRQILKDYPRRRDEQPTRAEAMATRKGAAKAPDRSAAKERPRMIATPETMGLSDGLARKIRQNARRDTGYAFPSNDTSPAKRSEYKKG